MCGIIGMIGEEEVAEELTVALNILQHRGQDAAGLLTFADRFHLHKGVGLVPQVFPENSFNRFKGRVGIGHVRYATQGESGSEHAQPFYINFPQGLGMVHNGNLVNFAKLRHLCREQNLNIVESSNDLELLLYTFASLLSRKLNGPRITPEVVFETVEETLGLAEGAFATLAIIGGRGLLAFQDPAAIRPLLMGRREAVNGGRPTYAFASESSCLEILGFQVIRELGPAEAVFIDFEGGVHHCIVGKVRKPRRFCVFEYIYFAREDSRFFGRMVASVRAEMGKALAARFRESNLHPDLVIDVPSSAWFFADALAKELNVPYQKGFVKSKYVGRSFIMANQSQREAAVRLKMNPMAEVVRDKKVAVVDDSLVRGTTSQRIVSLLKSCGAKEIYFVSAAPPVKHPCVYGIDISMKEELLAARLSVEEIRGYIGADAMIYQTLPGMREVFRELSLCTACFSGDYPTTLSESDFRGIARERETTKGLNF